MIFFRSRKLKLKNTPNYIYLFDQANRMSSSPTFDWFRFAKSLNAQSDGHNPLSYDREKIDEIKRLISTFTAQTTDADKLKAIVELLHDFDAISYEIYNMYSPQTWDGIAKRVMNHFAECGECHGSHR